jgi:hypothetical protein
MIKEKFSIYLLNCIFDFIISLQICLHLSSIIQPLEDQVTLRFAIITLSFSLYFLFISTVV